VLEKGATGVVYHGVAEEGIWFRDIAGVIGRRLNITLVSKTTKPGLLADLDRPSYFEPQTR
jgi:hypothetical protein